MFSCDVGLWRAISRLVLGDATAGSKESAVYNEEKREQGQDEVKLIDVTQAHFNAKCDAEDLVEMPDAFKKFGKYTKLKRLLYGKRRG